MAERQEIRIRLTESQPYPNKLDLSFLNQLSEDRTEFWGPSTVSPVASRMLVITTASAKGRRAKGGGDRPLQKENIHSCVSEPRCFKTGYEEVQMGGG